MLYFFVIVVEAISLWLNNKSENIIKILILLMAANISPGFGILLGLFNFLIKKV